MRRVVVTGMGIVSPLGTGVGNNWDSLLAGKSGLKKIDHFDASDFTSKIAGTVPRTSDENPTDGAFNPDLFVSAKEQRKMDPFIVYGMAAAEEAIKDSGYVAETEEQKERTGVMVGAGIGGLTTMYDSAITLHERGPRRLSPFCIPAMLINLASGHISIRHGACYW